MPPKMASTISSESLRVISTTFDTSSISSALVTLTFSLIQLYSALFFFRTSPKADSRDVYPELPEWCQIHNNGIDIHEAAAVYIRRIGCQQYVVLKCEAYHCRQSSRWR